MAYEILRAVANVEDPTASGIAKVVGVSPKVVNKHLKAFETLFVLQKLSPHVSGTGKDRYYLCDVGIAHFLGARRQRLLETWIFQELSAKRALLPAPSKRRLSYYRTTKGSILPFIVEDENQGVVLAIHALYKEKEDQRDVEIIKSFENALKKTNIPKPKEFRSYLLLPSPSRKSMGKTLILPWASIG